MILKVLSRKSNGQQLIKYVMRYIMNENKLQKDAEKPLVIRHNVRARTVEGFIKAFKENEQYRLINRSDKVLLWHYIISFSAADRDHITDDVLKNISKKFISLNGTDSLYVGAVHRNTASTHIHCLCSGTKLNGRSSRISKAQLKSIKVELDRFQQLNYPKLVNSLPAHGTDAKARNGRLDQVKTDWLLNKEKLKRIVTDALSKSTSQEEFISTLERSGYETYSRGGRLQGILDGSTKYRFSRLGIEKDVFDKLSKVEEAVTEISALRNRHDKVATNHREECKQEECSVHETFDELSSLRAESAMREQSIDELGGEISGRTSSATEESLTVFEGLRKGLAPTLER